MVLGIITAIAACPAIIGTTEAVRQGQRKNAKEQHRGLKSNLVVSCFSTSRGSSEINGGAVVLRNNKVRSLGTVSKSNRTVLKTDCKRVSSCTSRCLQPMVRPFALIIHSRDISSLTLTKIGVAKGKG